ncbi:MAG: metallophosphoesterase family protein [Gemmatimonadales bacterium]|nr:MAG: metallophosphoesterase family protein [Gemmatimonadales bacterium]
MGSRFRFPLLILLAETRPMRRPSRAVLFSLVGVLLVALAPGLAEAQNTLVPEGMPRYEPTGFPDRIVLTFTGDPAATQAVTWRTGPSVTRAVAEISVAGDSPGLHLTARMVEGRTTPLEAGNGLAHHHTVTFTDLRPNTLYAYRVGGEGTWSEWFQFRTAKGTFEPFSFLYFGDAQNAVKSHYSRTVRQAALDRSDARVMVHAGDLVNLRAGNHDDEWGEWFDAGGWLHGMIPSIPAPGNHEYVDEVDQAGREWRTLSPHWPVQFAFPGNGPDGMEETVYHVDFQGVRFIVLNSVEAVYDDAPDRVEDQARWLEALLRDNPNRWTVAVFHHPVVSVARGRDNPSLQEHWQPLFEEYGVDLVLQGHDHSYGRGGNLAEGTTAWDGRVGTMYVVSVAGPKMYFASEEALETFDRVGEDTQLYQTVQVEWDRIVFESRTTTGRLYDAFELHKDPEGPNRLVDLRPEDAERFCGRPDIPGYRADRCWEGTDFVRPGGSGGR